GSGGFGEVWKCEAPGGILKAIKFVYGNLNSDDLDGARAEQEQQALERVKVVRHPFVLSMDRIEVVGGELAIVMELADKSLHDLLEEFKAAGQPGIPRQDVIRYLLDAAEGLDHLIDKHQLQHLDVKPRNLFLIGDRVKVADFGLAKNVERASTSGLAGGLSPFYAAPEAFAGKISKQSDQYSLAIVYCELISGRRPFAAKNIRQLAVAHMSEPPDLSMVPPADKPIVAKALAKEPTKRFSSCAAFIRALAPTVVQTDATVDLDSEEADLGVLPPQSEEDAGPATAEIDVSALSGIPATTDPQTEVHKKLATYRIDAPEASAVLPGEVVWDGDSAASLQKTILPPAPPSGRDGEIDLGAPTFGEVRPEVTATKLTRGVLRPTLFLGFGAFGLRALTELRCRLLDRFGDLGQIPAYRYLFVDTDGDTIDAASTGTPEIALSVSETFVLPLQPAIAYRRRMIDHLNMWLPKEKLHSIPRSLHPQGSRALGRLAFVDNFARLQSRLRRELQVATLPDSMDLSVGHTGLSRGKTSPRVFVFASACGGSGGLLPDLGYSLRRLLRQLNYADATVTAYVYCGSPRDSASSRQEVTNAFATLTEINHFRQNDVTFEADYGPDGPAFSDPGAPFDATYLVTAKERTADSVRESVAHLVTYVTQDVASSLGPTLERFRKQAYGEQRQSFRSFGTYTSWFPRGLLLRVAARRAVAKLLDVWQATVVPKTATLIEKMTSQALADPGLRWEAIAEELNRQTMMPGVGCPVEATEAFLTQIETESAAPSVAADPGAWAALAYDKAKRWAGPGTGRELEALWKKSQFNKYLGQAAQQLGSQWDEYLAEQLRDLIRGPGNRLATAETGFRNAIAFCDQAIRVQWDAVERHYAGMKRLIEDFDAAKAGCQGGVKVFFGGTSRAIRHFVDTLKQFVRQRIAQDILEAGVQFFMTLRGRLEDRNRDLGFARQRIKHLRQILLQPMSSAVRYSGDQALTGLEIRDPFWEAVQGSATVRIVLPAGINDLEQSAEQFVHSLQPEHWLSLDQWLQAEALAPLGDLHLAATGGADVGNAFGRPLVEQAAVHLGTILPITDVAQVEFSMSAARNEKLEDKVGEYVTAAAPLVGGSRKGDTYLILPESEAGQSYTRAALRRDPDLSVIPVPNPIELTLLREQPFIGEAELEDLLSDAQAAYQETIGVPTLSPHARFDVGEWKPLYRLDID
ncbi:MAG: protein kinase, partial [Gemmataceae bacterium]|nr:protein kinase [Gemmataceae bacterium]